MIMIRVGGRDILVVASMASVIIIDGIKISKDWNWCTHILEDDISYTIINFNIILATLDLNYN